MLEVKLFAEMAPDRLEELVNEWLATNKHYEVKDVQYSTSYHEIRKGVYHSAAIIYKARVNVK